MGKIAFIFAGQGAQTPGMGKELCGISRAAAEIFARADAVRPGTSEMCFGGTEQELSETVNTQPCMYAAELAAAAALAERGIAADMAAGFSLGELAALAYCGAADFETGLRLVTERGRLMQSAAERTGGGMCAVVKLAPAEVERLCAAYDSVWPVNYNCPGQISVAGSSEQLAELAKDVRAAGGKALPLRVRGAFHSPFMSEAAESFREAAGRAELRAPSVTLYSDCTGEPYPDDPRGYAELLSAQIKSPVRWQAIVERMLAAGADTFVELGPGRVLSGLVAKIAPGARTFSTGGAEQFNEAASALAGVRGDNI